MLEKDTTPKNILLVDDKPENLLAFEAALEDLGHHIFTANSGNEALRKVLKQDFDLLLVDVQMPEMDGFELAELLHAKEDTKDIPILFITAISKEPEYIEKGYDVGGENYLFKPIEPETLRSKVEYALKYHEYKEKSAEYAAQAKEVRKEAHKENLS